MNLKTWLEDWSFLCRLMDIKFARINPCNDNILLAKATRKSARDLKNLHILPANSAEGLRSRRERCWGYVSTYENTPKSYHISPLIVAATLVVQGRAQLEHSSHIVKVLVKATCYHFKPWCILKEMTKPAGPFGTMPQESWHPGRVLNWLALSNSTAGKGTPMQVIKQLEHGRTSTTKKQNWSSFQTKYD